MTSFLQRGFFYEAEGKSGKTAMDDAPADQRSGGDRSSFVAVCLFDAKRHRSAGMGSWICAVVNRTWGTCCRRICGRIREARADDRRSDCTDVVLGKRNYRFDFSAGGQNDFGDRIMHCEQLDWFVHFS